MKKKALIYGITGQDGSYLAKYLLSKHYNVSGVSRKKNYINLNKLKIKKKINLFVFKQFNTKKIFNLLKKNFSEIYFLAGQSSVKNSFEKRLETYESQNLPLKIILDYIVSQKGKKTKFLYAGTSEMFGNINKKKRLSEISKKKPISPYGMSKLIGYEIIKSYRSIYNIPVCTAILFNHESDLRSNSYVIKKIAKYVSELNKNKKNVLKLGNINIKRDWGWGPEYMIGCSKILRSKKIDDYIIATGKTVSLREMIYYFFKQYNLSWNRFVKIEKNNFRKYEIAENYANINKLKKKINWFPKFKYRDVINKLSKTEL